MRHPQNSPMTGTPAWDKKTGRRFAVPRVIVVLGVATVATTIFSIGAYCLTINGGDSRGLRSSGPGGNGQTAADPEVVGPSCALAPAEGLPAAARKASPSTTDSASRGDALTPPIDQIPRPELRTATFALG